MTFPLGYTRLTELAAAVRDKPLEFEMRKWHAVPNGSRTFDCPLDHSFGASAEWPSGTTHCIGGLAQIRFCPEATTFEQVMQALELEPEAPYWNLFFLMTWPGNFSVAYLEAATPEARAEIAAQVIEYYRDMRWPEIARSLCAGDMANHEHSDHAD